MPTQPGMIIEFIFFVVLLLVVVGSITRTARQKQSRAGANRIITGEEPATEEQINKIITTLLTTKNWVQDMTESDRHRIERLREMRNEMVTPETQGH